MRFISLNFIIFSNYDKFEEQDVERYNWLCKIRKHLENNLQDEQL